GPPRRCGGHSAGARPRKPCTRCRERCPVFSRPGIPGTSTSSVTPVRGTLWITRFRHPGGHFYRRVHQKKLLEGACQRAQHNLDCPLHVAPHIGPPAPIQEEQQRQQCTPGQQHFQDEIRTCFLPNFSQYVQ